MSEWDNSRTEPVEKPTIGHLVEQLSEQVTRLARAEIALAKAELANKGKKMSGAIGLFAAAGALAFFLIPVLLFAIAGFIAPSLGWGWALLIVLFGAVVVIVVLALLGRVLLKRAQPLSPERATENIKQDVAVIKKGLRP